MVPMTVASAADVKATIRLVCSAASISELPATLAYHLTEKPWKSAALSPELKLNSTISMIGP